MTVNLCHQQLFSPFQFKETLIESILDSSEHAAI